jgi:hypothetical protein
VRPARAAKAAAALGLETVRDLLEHLPRDRREARTIDALQPGEVATVVVEVRTVSSRPVRRRGMKPLVEATVADERGDAGDLLQPAVAGEPLSARHPPRAARQVRGAQPLPRAAACADGEAASGRGDDDVAHYPRRTA